MKFKDPVNVTCPRCKTGSMQRVVDLLTLKATCPICESALIDTGVEMRQKLDAWESYIASIWLTGYLERRMDVPFTDGEIDQVKTLRSLAALVETRLAPNDRASSQAIELVEWAMEQLHSDRFRERRGPHIRTPRVRAASLMLDVPLIDAIDPGSLGSGLSTRSSMKVIRAIRLIALLALSLAVAIIAGNLTTRSFHWYYDLSDHAHMIWKVFFPTLLWGALLVSLSVEQPISGDELRVIKRYLATREDKLPWLFISERQTQLTRQAVNHIIRVAGETAKLGRIWPHMLRHSCGYYLADRGTDLRTMQDYLGHRDPKHTAHYTRVAGHRFEGLWR